jgi:hypothetical protein
MCHLGNVSVDGRIILKWTLRNVYEILVGKLERKRPLGRPRHRGKDSIKLDLKEDGCEDMNWINLNEDRFQWWPVVNTVMNHRVP